MVGVPTMRGMGDSLKEFGIGALGGLIFLIAYRLFGALGVLAAPLLAGSMIKGSKGETIAVMSGFMLLALGGMAVGGTSSSGDSGVM